jgi:hypothetical protein
VRDGQSQRRGRSGDSDVDWKNRAEGRETKVTNGMLLAGFPQQSCAQMIIGFPKKHNVRGATTLLTLGLLVGADRLRVPVEHDEQRIA